MPIEELKRTKRLVYSPNKFRDFLKPIGSNYCRKQANNEKIIIPYYYEEYRMVEPGIYSKHYKTRPEKNVDNVELAVKTINQLGLVSLLPVYDFPDEFLWDYKDDFAPPYNGPELLLNINYGMVKLVRQVMHFFDIDTIKLGDTVKAEDTQPIFKHNLSAPTLLFSYNEDYYDYVVEESSLLLNYTLSSLFSVMHESFHNLPNIHLNQREIEQQLDSYQFPESLKKDFFYLLEEKIFEVKGLTYQDISALAMRIYALAPESLLGRSHHLPNHVFIEGQYAEPQVKLAFDNVLSALKNAEGFNYPLLAKNKTLKLTTAKTFSKNLTNELAIVSLSNNKIHCSFEPQNLANPQAEEVTTTFDPPQTKNITESTSEKIVTSSMNPLDNAFLSQVTLTQDCNLSGIVPTPIKITFPIYIHDMQHHLIRYISFHVEKPPREKFITLAWPKVRYRENNNTIDLQQLCGAVSIPEEKLVCQSQGVPTDWIEDNCSLRRPDFRYHKFNTTFSNTVTNETCYIEFFPDLTTSSIPSINPVTNQKNYLFKTTTSSTLITAPSASLDNANNDGKLIRNKRLAYIPWEVTYASFDCRQQAKFEKMRIPYHYVGYRGEQIPKLYADSMTLAVKNLNKLNLFQLISAYDPSPIDFFDHYEGPIIKLATESYMTTLRTSMGDTFLPSTTLCDIARGTERIGVSKIGCRYETNDDFHQIGIAALIREIMHAIGLVDTIIGETVKVEDTQGIFKPKSTRPKPKNYGDREFRFNFNKPNRYDSYNNAHRSPQLLRNYSLTSLFSCLHEPISGLAVTDYKLNTTHIAILFQQYNFSQALKDNFITLVIDRKLNSRILTYQDIEALAKLIYHYAPQSLVGRHYKLPDFLFIEGQFLQQHTQSAFRHLMSALKKAENFEYALLAQNRTLVVKVSDKPIAKDLIHELNIVSLSDGKLICNFGDLGFLKDQLIVKNTSPANFLQSTTMPESTLENFAITSVNPIQNEFLSVLRLNIKDCQLTATMPETMQLTLPIVIDDSKHTLTRYITFNVENASPQNYLVVNRPKVNLVANNANVDLKWLCAAVSVPEENIVCQLKGLPIDWLQDNCLVIRNNLETVKFNVTFSNGIKHATCHIQFSPNSSLPLLFPSTDQPKKTMTSKISHYQKADHYLDESKAYYTADKPQIDRTANIQGKLSTTALWGSGIATAVSSLLFGITYIWIRRFRSRSTSTIADAGSAALPLLEQVVKVAGEEKINSDKKETLLPLKTVHDSNTKYDNTRHSLFSTKKHTRLLKESSSNHQPLYTKDLENKTLFFRPETTRLATPKSNETNLNATSSITSYNASCVFRCALYFFGFKPAVIDFKSAVNRMNQAERLENYSSFQYENELDNISQRLDSALQRYG